MDDHTEEVMGNVLRRERQRDRQAKKPTPYDLLRCRDVIVHGWLQIWRNGECSFEQALIGMVMDQAKRAEEHVKMLTDALIRNPQPIIIKKGD